MKGCIHGDPRVLHSHGSTDKNSKISQEIKSFSSFIQQGKKFGHKVVRVDLSHYHCSSDDNYKISQEKKKKIIIHTIGKKSRQTSFCVNISHLFLKWNMCKVFMQIISWSKIHNSGVTFCGMCLFMNVFEEHSVDSTLLGKTLCYQIRNLNIQTGSLL